MEPWIGLVRGINVGGRNKLPMARLVAAFEAAGCTDVQTYIQSGNVVFRPPAAGVVADAVLDAIERSHGFRPQVQLFPLDRLTEALEANPFPVVDPKAIHLFFLADEVPAGDVLDDLVAETEAYHISGSVVYLHAPDGVGRSKFMARFESATGCPATARNWRTVTKLAELAAEA